MIYAMPWFLSPSSAEMMRSANKVLQRLRKERVEIQHDISQVITLKYTPVLKFELDKRIAAGDRVFELLGDVDNDGDE